MVDRCGIRIGVICWSHGSCLDPLLPRHRVLDDSRSLPQTTHASTGSVAGGELDIAVRPVATRAECQACVALQYEIWGPRHEDAVPASILQVVAKVGGLVAGAFTGDGELVGFVFGLPALIDGTLAHWSHILGVRESVRNAGVGRMLKKFQRAELARRGIATIYWTYDPLVAKNAHLNLNVLGARVVEYVRDMYGTTASPLHSGLATDRLVVASTTVPQEERSTRAFAPQPPHAPVLTAEPRPGDVTAPLVGAERPRTLLVEIPAEFQQLAVQAPDRAALWHAAVRTHFEWALQHGYEVTRLQRDPVTSRAFYVFELPQSGVRA
jgi:chorismate synthase